MIRLSSFVTRSTSLVSELQASQPAERARVAEQLLDGLVRAGFTHCFGIPGRHVQALFHALPASGLIPIVSRHEQGAVFMADGFARAAGRPALVVATAGPGAGNMLTGVANAFAEGTPMLCVTGAPPRQLACRGAFQELGDDHTAVTPAIFAPVTRHNAQLSHPRQLSPTLRLALVAMAQGGPVNISVPSDLLDEPAEAIALSAPFPVAGGPDAAAVQAAALYLNDSDDVLILAGRGALGSSTALRALAEALQAPVVTTLHGRGVIDEDHPLALGAQGFSASHWAEKYLRGHRPKVVVAIGTSLREISTNVFDPVFQGTQALIHCTRDARAIGRHYAASVGVVADVGAFIEALLPLLKPRTANKTLARFKKGTPRFDEVALASAPGRVSPRAVVETIRRQLTGNDALVVDTGNSAPWSARYYRVHQPGTYFAALHLAAMGWGVAAAVGIKLAKPGDRVVALVGDGCFQMAGMEVATAVQHGVNVVWVVLNDARFNMVHQGTTGCYGAPICHTELSPVDCARVAEGLGAAGFHVNSLEELEPAIAAALACGRPAVVDVAIDPDVRPPMAGRFEAVKRFEEQ